MPSTNITADVVTASVIDYLSDAMTAGDYIKGDPSKFDPNSSDKSAWVQIWLSSLDEVIGSDPTTYKGTLTGWACSRNQDKQYEHMVMAKQVTDALHQACIPLIDHTAGGTPEVGRLTVRKISHRDTGTPTPNYQKVVITVEFHVDQYA